MRPPCASVAAAFVAALPASTQPSRATTTVGSFISGSWRRSLNRLTRSCLGPPRRWRAVDHRPVVPFGPDGREDVDDDGALGAGDDVVRSVAEDPPGATGSQVARLAIDREVHLPRDDHAQLLGRVTVLGHDGIRRELDDRQGDPLALDAPRPDLLAPDLQQREVGEVPQVAHRASEWGRAPDNRRRAECAACQPGMPWMPPPGGVEDEHRNSRGSGVEYGSSRAAGRVKSCRRSIRPPLMSPPTLFGL